MTSPSERYNRWRKTTPTFTDIKSYQEPVRQAPPTTTIAGGIISLLHPRVEACIATLHEENNDYDDLMEVLQYTRDVLHESTQRWDRKLEAMKTEVHRLQQRLIQAKRDQEEQVMAVEPGTFAGGDIAVKEEEPRQTAGFSVATSDNTSYFGRFASFSHGLDD